MSEIFLNPRTGSVEFDALGDLVITDGPETALYLAIATRLDTVFGLVNAGSDVPGFVTGAPPSVPDVITAAEIAVQELARQGILTLVSVQLREDSGQIEVTVSEAPEPLLFAIPSP